MKALRWLFALALAGAVAFAGVSAYFAVQLTAPARRSPGKFSEFLPSETQAVEFPAQDGVKLAAWFVPREGATQAAVLLHGYGSTRKQMLARARLLHAHGYAVLLYDARGHGQSGGERTSIGWHETRDLLGALDFLRDRGLQEFGLIGESQGGATIALAARELRGVRWVILESVYPTLRDAVDRRFRNAIGVPGWIGGLLMVPFAEWLTGIDIDAVAPIEHVAELKCPVFVLHGDHDPKTRWESGRAIFERALEPKSWWLVTGAAHVDLYGFAKADYEQRLFAFIDGATARLRPGKMDQKITLGAKQAAESR